MYTDQRDVKLGLLDSAVPVEVTQGQGNQPVDVLAEGHNSCMQRYYTGSGQPCMYAPGRIGSVKINFLVYTVCIHNLLMKATFDRLTAVDKDCLEP